MPFLRVIRDRRGYETTYLMHWYRDGQKSRSKVLYVFRSPSGVRVGRAPFDPAIVREIETQNPDIEFHWDDVRASQQVVEAAPEPRRRRPRGDGGSGDAPPPRPATPATAETPRETADAAGGAPAPPAPRPEPIPAGLPEATTEEQLAFLTQWYPVIRDRVAQRASDPERREGLLLLAERLNPAAWTDADELSEGLAGAAESLERLAYILNRRRRSRRRGASGRAEDGATDQGATPA